MTSYHNDDNLARAHIAADRLVRGQYDAGDGRGCSVGCHALDLRIDPDNHGDLAEALGWPEWLVHLQDRVFEGLPEDDAPAWHLAIVEAVPVGADLQPAYHRIMARILREVGWRAQQTEPDPWGVCAAVDRVAELHDAASTDPAAWAAAAARAAEAAAAARAEGVSYRQIRDIVLEELGEGLY